MLNGITPSLRFSAEERQWIQDALAKQRYRVIEALKPPAGSKLSASAVNGMTAEAQWAYKANSSTRPAKVPPLSKRPRAPRPNLRARVAQLERFIREAGLAVPEVA